MCFCFCFCFRFKDSDSQDLSVSRFSLRQQSFSISSTFPVGGRTIDFIVLFASFLVIFVFLQKFTGEMSQTADHKVFPEKRTFGRQERRREGSGRIPSTTTTTHHCEGRYIWWAETDSAFSCFQWLKNHCHFENCQPSRLVVLFSTLEDSDWYLE